MIAVGHTGKSRELTESQKNILAALNSIPASGRVAKRAGGLIPIKSLVSYDGRALSGLFKRGLLKWTEYGVEIAENEQSRESGYTVKKDPTFGDEIYRGEYGAAKIVRNEKDWAVYFFEPGELKSDEKITSKTRKACREWAIAWVTRGFF